MMHSKQLEKLGSALKGATKAQVLELLGYSIYNSGFDVWKYELIHNCLYYREMILFFAGEEVYDIQITDYLLGNKIKEYIY